MLTYINRSSVHGPYGGGAQFINAFHKYAPRPGIELVDNSQTFTAKPDVILLAGLDNQGPSQISVEQAIMYKMYMNPDCKLILRVNENDARKGTNNVDKLLTTLSWHVDATVFVSNWLQDYFKRRGWRCANNTVIYNGVDASIFKPQPKLNNGKLNIVTHHWSDNRMKGADIYEELDKFVGEHPDKFTFTYIGRHKCDFKHTNVVKPLYGEQLGKQLGQYDVYVSASRHDPGPNHITESISCNIPTYVHYEGGGCVEFAGEDHSYDDWDELKQLLLSKNDIKQNTSQFKSWQECVDEYANFCTLVHNQK